MKGQRTSNYSILSDASSRVSFLGHIRAVCFHSDTRHASFRIHHTAVRSLGCTREDETETAAVTFGRNDVDTFRVHTSLCDTNRETPSTWLVYVCARARLSIHVRALVASYPAQSRCIDTERPPWLGRRILSRSIPSRFLDGKLTGFHSTTKSQAIRRG